MTRQNNSEQIAMEVEYSQFSIKAQEEKNDLIEVKIHSPENEEPGRVVIDVADTPRYNPRREGAKWSQVQNKLCYEGSPWCHSHRH